MITVAVTGGSGKLGGRSWRPAQHGYEVVRLDRVPAPDPVAEPPSRVDLTDYGQVARGAHRRSTTGTTASTRWCISPRSRRPG